MIATGCENLTPLIFKAKWDGIPLPLQAPCYNSLFLTLVHAAGPLPQVARPGGLSSPPHLHFLTLFSVASFTFSCGACSAGLGVIFSVIYIDVGVLLYLWHELSLGSHYWAVFP